MFIATFHICFENGPSIGTYSTKEVVEGLNNIIACRDTENSYIDVVNNHVEVKGDELVLLAGANYGVYADNEYPEEQAKVIIAKDEDHAKALLWHEFK